MVVGICGVALLSQRSGYRLGGVMVIPLLAVYTLREPFSPVVFAAATVAAWGALWALREYTLSHGRRVFLVAVLVGAVASVGAAVGLAWLFPARFSYFSAEIVASVFPGIAAYNLMRVESERRRADILAIVVGFLLLLALGAATLRWSASVDLPMPAFLRLPSTDALALLGVAPRGVHTPHLVGGWLTTGILAADVVLYELFRSRYDVRLAGIVLVPLLAVFSVRYAGVVAVYVVGASLAFFAISYVHWVTLLYGRNLLAVGMVCGLCYTLAVGALVGPAAPGVHLFFIGLFVGIGAYNLHRTAPRNRGTTIRLSAGLFVAFYGVLLLAMDVPESGLAGSYPVAYTLLGGFVLVLVARELVVLERSLPDGDAFAGASVFADVSGTDAEGSPLVEGER